MSCEFANTVLHGYFDNELDALRAAEFERHLEGCPECTETLAAMKTLRSSLNAAQLYEKIPVSLRNKVAAGLGSSKTVSIAPPIPWRWLAVAAAALLLVFIGWRVVSMRPGSGEETMLVTEVVDAHLRSLQPGHLTDVVSSDQHTVKPWFDGKLDFAPPVRDFAEQEFPLQGGRLDVIHGRAIAALVYGRRKHFVNVFVWPTKEPDTAPRRGSQQGYNWTNWRRRGMEFTAVSDAAPADLDKLQQLLTE